MTVPPPIELHALEAGDFRTSVTEAELMLTPERRLLLALLERTLEDLVDRDDAVRRDALRWLRSDRPLTDGFSFPFVADQLGLDVTDVRSRLDELAGGRDLRRLAQLARRVRNAPERARAA